MYSIELPTGEILEMPADVQFSFELNNSVFSTSDTSILPGSFSFPVTLPATGVNHAIFRHPHLPTAANPVRTISGVWIRAQNVRMFFGDLTLRRAGNGMEVSIVANPLTAAKNTQLNEVDLGGDRTFGADDTARNTLMLATANTPDNYDFVFFPVLNKKFYTTAPSYLAAANVGWINRYDTGTAAFDLTGGAIIPFPKLYYVLQRIFAELVSDWAFVNNWQTTTELKRLYLFNLTALYDLENEVETLPDTFDLQRHVSPTKVNEFLKKLLSLFNLGVFKNPFSRTISLEKLEDLIKRVPAHDWTAYTISEAIIEYEDNEPYLKFSHAVVVDDTISYRHGFKPTLYPDDLTGLDYLYDWDEVLTLAATLAVGIYKYYLVSTESIIYINIEAVRTTIRQNQHRRASIIFDDTPEFIPGMQVLSAGTERIDRYDTWPRYDANGAYLYLGPEPDPGEEQEKEAVEKDNPDALCFYRGMLPDRNGDDVPCGSPSDAPVWGSAPSDITTSAASVATAAHSLFWQGDRGLFVTNWQTWYEMIRNGKPVTYRLLLPIHELVSFNFQDKITILNMDYFVKTLTVQRLTSDGKFLVEAKLFSVI